MAKKPTLLRDLSVDEVSLVDTPANQHSLAVLFKRYGMRKGQPDVSDGHVPTAIGNDDKKKKPCKTCGKVHDGDCMKKSLKDRVTAFVKSFKLPDATDIEEIPEDDEPEDFAAINARFVASLHKALDEHDSPDNALIATGQALEEHNALILASVSKGLGIGVDSDTDEDEDDQEGADTNAATPDAGASSGDRSPTTTTEKGMKKNDQQNAGGSSGASGADDVNKKADEQDESEKADIAKKDEQITSLTKRLEAMEKKEKERAANDEAVTLVGKSGIPAKDVAALITKLDGDEEGIALVKGIVTKAVAFAKNAALFEEVGGEGDEAEDAEFTKAFEAVKKANPKLTDEQATALVYEQHPELYDADDDLNESSED